MSLDFSIFLPIPLTQNPAPSSSEETIVICYQRLRKKLTLDKFVKSADKFYYSIFSTVSHQNLRDQKGFILELIHLIKKLSTDIHSLFLPFFQRHVSAMGSRFDLALIDQLLFQNNQPQLPAYATNILNKLISGRYE